MRHKVICPWKYITIHSIGRRSGNEIRASFGRQLDILVPEEEESLCTFWSGHKSVSCCHGVALDLTAFSERREVKWTKLVTIPPFLSFLLSPYLVCLRVTEEIVAQIKGGRDHEGLQVSLLQDGSYVPSRELHLSVFQRGGGGGGDWTITWRREQYPY